MKEHEYHKDSLAHFAQKFFEEPCRDEDETFRRVKTLLNRGLRTINKGRYVFFMFIDKKPEDIPVEFAKTLNDDFWEIL